MRASPAGREGQETLRDVAALPKAHLHLHLTGSMRRATLAELAAARGRPVPVELFSMSTSVERPGGWFRFQRGYDLARAVLSPGDVGRVMREAAEDARADGVGWLELQVDPSGYARLFGGLVPAMESLREAASCATDATGVPLALIISANRTRHPLIAQTLARLAVRAAAETTAGPGVVGFGLSNDERRGETAEFAGAFRIAVRGGLLSTPHAGELCGADSVASAVHLLGARRLGHGVRAAEDPRVLDLLARNGVTAEVCPTSNVALGVYRRLGDVPLPALVAGGVAVALGADDPLLFGAGVADQYRIAREVHGFSDVALAGLAADSIRASAAPLQLRRELLAGVETWLACGPGEAVDPDGLTLA